MLPQLRMLFQSTHEDRQDAEALAEPGERIDVISIWRLYLPGVEPGISR